MIIGHLSAFSKESPNGVICVVYNMAINQVKQGNVVYVFGYKEGLEGIETKYEEGVCLKFFPKGSSKNGSLSQLFLKYLHENPDGIDLMHFHSVYTKMNIVASKSCSMPYIVTPHGGYALENRKKSFSSYSKKIFFDLLFEKKFVKNSLLIHALNPKEQIEIPQLFGVPKEKIVIIPNGIDLKMVSKGKYSVKTKKRIVFIGRIDKVHKGLDILLNGIYTYVANGGDNFILTIVGPNSSNDVTYISDYITSHKLGQYVHLQDALYGKEKEKYLLKNTDLFVHTSRWEGFPMAVLEALSYGIPVLVSKETNIGEYIKSYKAGWVLEDNTAQDVASMLRFIEKDSDFDSYSSQALKLISAEFRWDALVRKLVVECEKHLD